MYRFDYYPIHDEEKSPEQLDYEVIQTIRKRRNIRSRRALMMTYDDYTTHDSNDSNEEDYERAKYLVD